ncbi:hypothetical protein H9L17_02480 [Thermomonas brevis]|uniref:Terminase small subunit n=1 Tax=Thermomonas brevis TaxID=215691 RepID=A0A7G9QUM8_9GAMM|nr:hypothetical protein [Thermomonas brevis]QNN47053.1 hypothetical protein H9L17_02480 [Thermomonas brevis]
MLDLASTVTQTRFGELVGVTQPTVSDLCTRGILREGASVAEWLRAYCDRLREVAAGRLGRESGLDLVQERAALAREQREGQAIKNAVARKEYAPIGLLADVLGMASSAVVDRFDQLEGALRKVAPDLPDAAKTTVLQVIADARNAWISETAAIVSDAVDAMGNADTDETDDDANPAPSPAPQPTT